MVKVVFFSKQYMHLDKMSYLLTVQFRGPEESDMNLYDPIKPDGQDTLAATIWRTTENSSNRSITKLGSSRSKGESILDE